MPVVVNRHLVDPAEADRWTLPRHDVVEEGPPTVDAGGALCFTARRGPFHQWQRRVSITDPGDRPGIEASARVEVSEQVDYRLAVPVWGPVFGFALRHRLRRATPPGARTPWWAPPEVLDVRAATVLSLLGVLALFAGYLGTLLTQTVTYAARQFDASTTEQGTLLAAVRIGVLLSLVIVASADRRGRRVVLIGALFGSIALTALGSLAPGMVWLGVAQTGARALSTVVAILIGIVAVEEMPSGARAFAISVLAMAAGLGAGACVANLLYVDLSDDAWRGAYLVPLLALVPVAWVARRLPETQRFEAHHHPDARARDPADAHAPSGPTVPATGGAAETEGSGFAWPRFVLLAASGFLWALFLAPAAQFLNEFLRAERGFSGIEITVFVLATNTPGGLGIVLGGRLADRRGRRLIGIIGIAGGVAFTVVTYLVWGWPLWAASVVASVIGAMAIPALGVYGPELFPTAQRGRANGGLQVVSVTGSSIGLLGAGWLADRLGGLGPAMAVLALGPLLLVVLVALFYPETAHRELEEINPVDRPGWPPAR